MCGRYDLSQNPAAIKARFRVPSLPEFALSPDVRPTESKPIVRLDRAMGARACVLARWGLVPAWAKDLNFGNRCINARSETVAKLPAFRQAYEKRRCLVPMNAFFEWSGPPGQRSKWRIRVRDEEMFALAGLWEWWKEPAAESGVETFTIITCEANEAMDAVHDRMPVIVDEASFDRWLDPAADAAALLVPFDGARMVIEKS